MTTVQNNGSILATLDPTTTTDPILLYQAGTLSSTLKTDPDFLGLAAFVNDLRLTSVIESMAATGLPEYSNTDSDTARLKKSLDHLWNSERKQLDILFSPDGTNWHFIGAVPLINSGGYPYRQESLIDHYTKNTILEMSDEAALGVQLRDVGTGLLSGSDSLTIMGATTEEVYLKDQTLTGGSGEGETVATFAGIGDNNVLLADPGWVYNIYDHRIDDLNTGNLELGYFVLRNSVTLIMYGGGATEGDLKRIKILSAWDDLPLIETDLATILGQDTNLYANVFIDTSAYYGKTVKLRFEKTSTDPIWGHWGIVGHYFFINE